MHADIAISPNDLTQTRGASLAALQSVHPGGMHDNSYAGEQEEGKCGT